jgi:hypothetical protein
MLDIKIDLKDLLDGTFKFYLDDNFKNEILSKLKEKNKDWRIVAKHLDMNVRNLFGIRRGFGYWKASKTKRFISQKHIIKIKQIFSLKSEDVEKHVTAIKLGQGGLRSNIKLPTYANLNKEPIKTIKRALAEHIFIKNYENNIDLTKLSSNFSNEDYIIQEIKIYDKKFNSLRLRGLKPDLKNKEEFYKITYRNPGTDKRVTRIIPKKIIFNEIFAKEFGKWLGDRCGGPNKIGVANKEFEFVEEFRNFLINQLKQPKKGIIIKLTCRSDFIPDNKLKSKVDKIIYTQYQLGDYAFRIEASNKILKNLAFDILEKNIFNILFNSKKSVRNAFYAGFFEAEGSVPANSKQMIFSFGFNLNKKRDSDEFLDLLRNVIKFKYLLSIDGFNPRISRKISDTKKSSTLKYDIILPYSKDMVKFINEAMLPYLSHKKKRAKLMSLGGDIIKKQKTKKDNEKGMIQPEVNIGLVGHC